MKDKVFFKKSFIFFILCFLIKLFYDYQVINFLPDRYMKGVSYGKDFCLEKYLLGWFVFISFLIPFCLNKIEDFLDLYTEAIFIIIFLPMCSSYGINNLNDKYSISNLIFFIMFFILFFLSKKHNLKFNVPDLNIIYRKNIFYVVLFFVFFAVFLFVKKFNGLHISFNLDDVYDVRETAHGLPIWFNWIKNSFGTTFLPVLLVFSLRRKNLILLIFSFFLEILLFSVGMDKSYLFNYAIAFIVGIFPSKFYRNYLIIPLGILCGLLFSFLEFFVFKTTFLFYFFIRRIFYIPCWMGSLYFDYFSKNGLMFFSQGVFLLSKFIHSSFDLNYLELINLNYFNCYMPSPNVGMIGEGFMQLGYCSVVIYPFIYFLFGLFSDALLRKFSPRIKCITALAFSMSIGNISLLSGHYVSILITFFFFCFLLKNTKTYNFKLRLK